MFIKKSIFLFAILCTISVAAALLGAQDSPTFSVSGELAITKEKGALHLFLVTREEFKAQDGTLALHLVLDPKPKAKSIPYRFENVPAAEYGIRCFQDENGNGKLDMGGFGPKEPWGMSKNKRPFMRSPRFEEICFRVDADVTGLMIKVK